MVFLTHKERSSSTPRNPTKFPTAQFVYLALVRVSEPIAITSVFPYCFKLVRSFGIDNAPFYAGLLISAFALAECISSMFWGSLSDRYGRKPVLLAGCCGTIISLLTFGCSTNFWMALLGRALGGLLNGNQGVIQTMVGELITLPEHEPRAYAIMPFVWSVGAFVGPFIGGFFSEPHENFPSVFPTDSIFARLPYLLPNVICASLLVVAVVLGYFMIEESHPDMQPWSNPTNHDRTNAETPLFANVGGNENAPADLRRQSFGTFNAVRIHERRGQAGSRSPTSDRPRVFTKRVTMLIVALGIFTYHSMTYDNLFPIYLQDSRADDNLTALSTSSALAGGLGLSTQRVGIIMLFNGLIALFIQGIVFPFVATWLGIWKVFLLCTFGHPIAYFIVPYLAFLPDDLVYPGIYAALIIRNFFAILAWPVLLILIKEAAPSSSSLGKINGFAAAAGASCRTLANPVAGSLYSIGTKIKFTPLAWWASALVACIGIIQALFISRERRKVAHVSTIAHFASNADVRAALASRGILVPREDDEDGTAWARDFQR